MRNTDKKKENMVLMSMRISAEDKELIEEKATSLLKEYAMQLGKIGSNLNQIAKYLNSGGNYFSIYFELKEAMKELLDLKFKILPALEDVACGRRHRRKSKKESGE